VRRVRARAPALPVSDLLRSARDFGQGQAVKSLVYELWRTVEFWDVAKGTLKKSLTGHSGSVNAVAFSPDGKTLVNGSDDMTVKLWNVPSGALLQKSAKPTNDNSPPINRWDRAT